MKASTIINDDMTLDEKLAAIEQAMKDVQQKATEKAQQLGLAPAPVDPAELTMCEGCE